MGIPLVFTDHYHERKDRYHRIVLPRAFNAVLYRNCHLGSEIELFYQECATNYALLHADTVPLVAKP